ncbi:hypothetical protein GH714_033977 [Hevea brasiliensis]|uniref:Uncharacterized protein n=1 Tax=Hevea brasiliensis TaxID=3981 RepID=A0A6A6NA61_HEVBR|nr:hypothetical protein GH714_033977 [Hevea brasiliensis]
MLTIDSTEDVEMWRSGELCCWSFEFYCPGFGLRERKIHVWRHTIGVLAACVVLFVPMVMAGWHLSRNKVLFFSGALFITLAIVVWDVKPSHSRVRLNTSNSNSNTESGSMSYDKIWDWSRTGKVKACEFQRLDRSDASDLLNGSWVVIAGDSQARLIVQSLLNLILDSRQMESIKGDLFKRHSDYEIVIEDIGMKLDFIWAPYVSLRSSVVSLLPFSPELGVDGPVTGAVSVRSPHLFWLGMPMLINGMLNTEEKREKMSDEMWHSYDRALRNSRLLRRYGGPLLLLDIQSMSWNCGPRCTADGMHYDGAIMKLLFIFC